MEAQPEEAKGKEPKKGRGAGKKWLIFGIVIALVVVGIGFIPVTKTVAYSCQTTKSYDCYQTEEYACQEAYTCYHDETYVYNDYPQLTYTQSNSYSQQAFWTCDETVHTTIRNTDSVGGYFTVTFKVQVNSVSQTATATLWISAGATQEFTQAFSVGCGATFTSDTPTVTPPTKTVQKIGTHSVAGTCYRAGTCEREVWTTNGCSQQVDDTCYVQEKGWLFW